MLLALRTAAAALFCVAVLPAQLVIDEMGHGLEIVENGGVRTLQVDTKVIMDAGRDNTVGGHLDIHHGSLIPPYGTAKPEQADCSAAKLGTWAQEMRPGFYALWVCREVSAATFRWRKIQTGAQPPDPPTMTYPEARSEWLFDDFGSQVVLDTGTGGKSCFLGASSAPDGNDPAWSPYGLEFGGLETDAQFVDCGATYNFAHTTQDYTLAVMARADSISGTDALITKAFRGIPHDGYRFTVEGGPRLSFRANGSGDLILRTEPQPLGGWRHYALVYHAADPASGATVEFYLDGQLVTSSTQVQTLSDDARGGAPFRIGSIESSSGFHGGIGGAWVWRQALTGVEVAGHCVAGADLMAGRAAPGVAACQ